MNVLLREGNEWHQAASGSKILWCAQCYGASAPPEGGHPEIKILKGVMIVSQESGSRELRSVTAKFRLDSFLRFRLIGRYIVERDGMTGGMHKVSINYITGNSSVIDLVHDERGKEKKIIKKYSSLFSLKITMMTSWMSGKILMGNVFRWTFL